MAAGRSVGRPPLYALLVGRAVCGALEASAHNVVIKLPRDHFDLRLNKGGSSSSHREGGREKRSQFVPPFLPPLASLSLSYSASPHCRSRMFSRTRIQTSAGGGRARRRRAHFAYCRSLPSVFEATPGAASLPLLLQRDKWPNSRALSLGLIPLSFVPSTASINGAADRFIRLLC